LSEGALDEEYIVADAVRQGFYARSLRHLMDYVPANRILVLQYERCVSDPVGQLQATYRFLGLADHQPTDLRRPVNLSGSKVPVPDDACRRLIDIYASDVLELVSMIPSVDLDLWPNFASM
jgi:hypothetical protein